MTRGITEERLMELIAGVLSNKDRQHNIEECNRLETIIDGLRIALTQCTELSPWMPIDENTPKDKELHLVHADIGQWIGWPNDPVGRNYATHYQELPDDPK